MMKTKNWMRTAIFAVLAAAATACTDNDLIDKDVNNTPDIKDRKMTIYAASGDEAADTRVAYEDGVRTLKWQKEDRLAVVLMKDGKVRAKETDFLFNGKNGDRSGSFTGTAIEMVEGGTWSIYYPNRVVVDNDGTVTLSMKGQTQTKNNNTEHLRNYILLGATGISNLNDGCKLEMKSSIMKFVLKNVPSEVGKLTNLVWMVETATGTRSMTLGFTPGAVKFDGTNTSLTAYLSFMPQDMNPKTDGKFTVILTGEKTYVAEGKVNTPYEAGKRYTAEIGEGIMEWKEKAIMALTVEVSGSNDLRFSIPFPSYGSPAPTTPAKLTVDWGDGTSPREVASGTPLTSTDDFNYIYNTAGTYTITITSDQTNETQQQIPDFNFRYKSGDNRKKLISMDTPLLNTAATNFSNCFYECTALQSIPSGLFDKNTAATDFSLCFSECTALQSIPNGLFNNNTQVTHFISCFEGCTALKEIPKGLFNNNTQVTDFQGCFRGCTALKEIPQGLFDENKAATGFNRCFSSCTALQSIPKGLFNNNLDARDFNVCFYNCTHLVLHPFIFSTTEDKSRFSKQEMYFGSCFQNVGSALESGKAGTAPDLWKYEGVTWANINNCFTGATKLDNYPIIPKSWGGPFEESVATP